MFTFFRTALYTTNLPLIERGLRMIAGVALVTAAIGLAAHPVLIGIAGGAGLFIAATAFVGFCPACYFFGRSGHRKADRGRR